MFKVLRVASKNSIAELDKRMKTIPDQLDRSYSSTNDSRYDVEIRDLKALIEKNQIAIKGKMLIHNR